MEDYMAEPTRNKRNRGKERYWSKHIKLWKDSGLRQVAYCRQKDLSRTQFTYWKCKLAKKATPVTFIPIPGKTTRSQVPNNEQGCLKLNIGSTYQVEISDGFSPDTLSTLIRILGKI